jgi:hypothetical protein
VEATQTPAVTRVQIIEDALKWARQFGAIADGGCFFAVPADAVDDPGDWYAIGDDQVEVSSNNLLENPELRGKVCGVCLAGAVYYAEIMRGLRPGDAFPSAFAAIGDAAEQAKREFGIDHNTNSFSSAIDEGGTEYVVRVLELQLEREKARVSG